MPSHITCILSRYVDRNAAVRSIASARLNSVTQSNMMRSMGDGMRSILCAPIFICQKLNVFSRRVEQAMSFLHVPSTQTPDAGYPPAEPAIKYSFPLDPWQQQAVSAIHRGDNVLVTAKTGSGKTLVGEYQIAYSLRKGARVFYTTPIKSLTNQKYNDLKHLFPANSVGILTGDIKSNPDADIVVMTTEILRNLLFKQSTSTARIGTAGAISLTGVDAVVFDEVHYINDVDRGHVWEETIILLPPEIKLILLSATIDSPEVFASWIGAAKQRQIVLLKTSHRIVPLIHGIYDPKGKDLPLRPLKAGDEAPYQAAAYAGWLRDREARAKEADDWKTRVRTATAAGDSVAGSAGKVKLAHFTHTLNECVAELKTRDLMPALFFVMSRKECERYAENLTGSLIDSTESASVRHIISFHLHKYAATLEFLAQYHQIVGLLERGIAFHHSGLLPLLKEIVELLFSRGFIKALFCTETFAVGLNMPARTVVFLDMKKPVGDGGGFRPFRADEYIQRAGRAGRRGKDTRGIVLYLPSRIPLEPDELRGVFTGSLVPLTSRLQFHYDFLLKAIHSSQSATVPLWNTLIDASFWSAQQAAEAARQRIEHTAIEAQLAASPITQAQRTDLDEKARIESVIKVSANAGKRKAQLELDRWTDRHMGPAWKLAAVQYAGYKKLETELAARAEAIVVLTCPVGSTRVAPVLRALAAWGALDIAEDVTAPKLTKFGTLATEINEGNPMLIAKLYETRALAEYTQEEIVSVLGAFIVDREAEQKTVHPRALPLFISDRVKETLVTVDMWGQQGVRIDLDCVVESPENFWSLATLWVCIGHEWVSGASATELVAKYEIYEGNLMRGLLKLANILNEWIAMATYTADVDMLDKLKDTHKLLLRDISIPESLYLHL